MTFYTSLWIIYTKVYEHLKTISLLRSNERMILFKFSLTDKRLKWNFDFKIDVAQIWFLFVFYVNDRLSWSSFDEDKHKRLTRSHVNYYRLRNKTLLFTGINYTHRRVCIYKLSLDTFYGGFINVFASKQKWFAYFFLL